MKIEGSYSFTSPVEKVWALLHDPVTFAQAMPDCEGLRWVHENRFAGALRIHAGLFQSRVVGAITITAADTPYELTLQAAGHSAEGSLTGSGRLWLAAQEGETTLHYSGEVTAAGQFAEAGAPYLQTVARSILRQNFTEMARQLTPAASSPGGGATAVLFAQPAPRPHRMLFLGIFAAAGLFSLGGALLLRRVYRWWVRLLARQVVYLIRDEASENQAV
ncbi:MAG: hypothetical protein IAE79_22020 [Anaerolinea sp.]|nr:hypothetical protein [Anaerolinea sp.]